MLRIGELAGNCPYALFYAKSKAKEREIPSPVLKSTSSAEPFKSAPVLECILFHMSTIFWLSGKHQH